MLSRMWYRVHLQDTYYSARSGGHPPGPRGVYRSLAEAEDALLRWLRLHWDEAEHGGVRAATDPAIVEYPSRAAARDSRDGRRV